MATTTHDAPPATDIPEWTLADRLAKARKHAGLEQPELADRIGIARSSLSAYENGHRTPRRPVLLSWSLATGVPLAWILHGSTDQQEGLSICNDDTYQVVNENQMTLEEWLAEVFPAVDRRGAEDVGPPPGVPERRQLMVA